MSQKLIRSALESRLATWAAAHSPVLQVAWQNAPFTPPTSTYLRAHLLPADTDSRDLKGDHRQYLGVFQVSICAPAGTGPAAVETIVAELETLFPVNLRLTSGAITVTVTKPLSASAGANERGLNVVNTHFRYQSDVI